MWLFGGGELSVQIEHPLHMRHHPVVTRNVGGFVEVDGADGESFDVLGEVTKESSTQNCADALEIEIQHFAIQ